MKLSVSVYLAVIFSIIVESHMIKVPKRVDSIIQQCVDAGFDGACTTKLFVDTTRMCKRPIRCAVKVGKAYYAQPGKYPKDGTPCGERKICRRYMCLDVDTMPDIDGSTETVKCKGIVPYASRIEFNDSAENDVFYD